jgi:hypothetical protein
MGDQRPRDPRTPGSCYCRPAETELNECELVTSRLLTATTCLTLTPLPYLSLI